MMLNIKEKLVSENYKIYFQLCYKSTIFTCDKKLFCQHNSDGISFAEIKRLKSSSISDICLEVSNKFIVIVSLYIYCTNKYYTAYF